MNCPVCGVDLALADRHAVELDYCPTCRGAWLDCGELGKIVERAAGTFERDEDREPGEYRRRADCPHGSGHDGNPTRESLLGKLCYFG